MAARRLEPAASAPQELDLVSAAAVPPADALARLDSAAAGLSSEEASRRLVLYGPNVLRSRGVSALSVLGRQVRSYLLGLLLFAAVVSAVVGDHTEALIIGAIMAMSVGLSFFNEYRSEKAVESLHSQIRHLAFVERDGRPIEVNVTEIVPGDVVHLRVGDVVPADLRLLAVHELECDESVLTGESQLSEKIRRSTSRPARSWGRSCGAAKGAGSWFARGRIPPSARLRFGSGSGRDRPLSSRGCRRFRVFWQR